MLPTKPLKSKPCREQTEEQLRGTTASDADKQRMLQVLQRMQDASESGSDSSSDEEVAEAREAEQLLHSLELQARTTPSIQLYTAACLSQETCVGH